MEAARVFISYTHKDEDLRARLVAHLSPMVREGLISVWHDRALAPGSEFDPEIGSRLDEAQVILLLVSSDFVASEYCYSKELTRAIERHNQREACVIPVIVRPVDWKSTPFARLQALPTEAKPVTQWPDWDTAFLDVAQGVRRIVSEWSCARPDGRIPPVASSESRNRLPGSRDLGCAPKKHRGSLDGHIADPEQCILSLPREIRDHIPESGGGRGFNLSEYSTIPGASGRPGRGEAEHRSVVLNFTIRHAGNERFAAPTWVSLQFSSSTAREIAQELLNAASTADDIL